MLIDDVRHRALGKGHNVAEGVIRLWKQGKLCPRFIGRFRIMAWVGKVTNRLDFPDKLNQIHTTFYVP